VRIKSAAFMVVTRLPKIDKDVLSYQCSVYSAHENLIVNHLEVGDIKEHFPFLLRRTVWMCAVDLILMCAFVELTFHVFRLQTCRSRVSHVFQFGIWIPLTAQLSDSSKFQVRSADFSRISQRNKSGVTEKECNKISCIETMNNFVFRIIILLVVQ
jgi:hypothetical protein